MKSKLFTILTLISILFSCKKDDKPVDTPAQDGKFLKKINYWTVATNKEVTIREVILDASGNLTGLKTYTNNAQGGVAGDVIWEFTSIEKDASGRLAKISGQDKMQNKAISYDFTYDASGNLTKSVLKQEGADIRTRNYTYDSSNRLLTAEEIANNNSNKLVWVKTYTYAGTSESPATLKDDQRFYSTVKNYTLKFDAKKNPSQAAPKALFAMDMIDFYKNNLIESSDGSTTTTFTVEYNSSGYAVSSTNGSGSGLKFVYGD